MGDELEVVRKYRKQIPEIHRGSLDTRVQWLWHQRFGTVQTIYQQSPDPQDVTAASLIIQAIIDQDLNSIELIFQRLEGGAQTDEAIAIRKESTLVL